MARTSKFTPGQLLELARTAVEANPEVRVAEFRELHEIGSNEAQAVLSAAKFEIGYRQYGKLRPEDVHPRYRDLVAAPQRVDWTTPIDLDAEPDALRASVDAALGAAREALGGIIEQLRATARRVVTEVDARAGAEIRAAEVAVRDLSADVETAQRREAEVRADAAQFREHHSADIARLTQEVREQARERVVAEKAAARADVERGHALDSLERERTTARDTISALTCQLADSQKAAGASESQARSLEDAVSDLRRRLDAATEALGIARRDSAISEARESAASARAAALESAHAAEMGRLEAHAAALKHRPTPGTLGADANA